MNGGKADEKGNPSAGRPPAAAANISPTLTDTELLLFFFTGETDGLFLYLLNGF